MRRSLLVLAGFAVVLLVSGCGSLSVEQGAVSTPPPSTPADYTTPSRPATPAMAKNGPVDPSSTFKLVTSLDGFALDLLTAEAKAQPEGNIVLSTASIHDALTMTANGASGQTATEMLHALRLDTLGLQQADRAWAHLIASTQGNRNAEVRIANSLWLRQGIAFQPAFLKTNQDYFAADTAALPDDPAAGAAQINDWVSQRTVPLPAAACDELRVWLAAQKEYRLAQGPAWNEAGRVVPKKDGSQMAPSTLKSQWWNRVARQKIDPHLPIHGLRDSFGTWVYETYGVKQAQEWLGHSDPATTLRHYVRLTTAARAKAVAGLDEVTRAAIERAEGRALERSRSLEDNVVSLASRRR